MPIYEYRCRKCEKSFDHLARRMSASGDKVKCPHCGSDQTARALSVFAVGAEGSKTDSAPPTCGRCGGAPGSCSM
jgi:putative FmdB family regulatory protein